MGFISALFVGIIIVVLLAIKFSKKEEVSKYKQLDTVAELNKLSAKLSDGTSSAEDRKEWERCMSTLETIAYKGSGPIDNYYSEMKERYLEYMKKHHASE